MISSYFQFLDFSLSDNSGSVCIAILMALLAPVLYFCFASDPPNSPPRYSIIRGILTGEYEFKSLGPLGVVLGGYRSLGEIFRVRLFNQNLTFFIGPEANKVFFEAKDSQLSQREVYHFTVPVFGKNIVYDAAPKIMMQQLKFVNKGLNMVNMMSHVGKIVMEAEAFFARWPESGEVDLMGELSTLIIMTASRCLLGREIRENVQEEFAELYQQLSDGMSHLSYFFPHAPTKAHRLRDQARRKIVKIFSSIIQGRRKAAAEGKSDQFDDFLQVMVDAEYTDGTKPSDDDIVGLLLAALFAGQHTSNITSTWMGLLIMQNKQRWMPRILDEQKSVMEKYNNVITLDGLAEMNLLHASMKETLRMYPPLILLMRKVLEPIAFKSYVVPKGDIAIVCPPVSHRIGSVFANPDEFNPDRFLGDDADDIKTKFAFLAFGGGRHQCLGERFGFLQVKTIWSVMCRKFDFELCSAHPKPDYSGIVVGPTMPCNIRFKRKADPYSFTPTF